MKDHQFISGIQNQDKNIIRIFYNSTFDKARAYLIKKGKVNSTDIESVIHDSYIILFEKVTNKSFTLSSSLSTFFFGILNNKAKQAFEKEQQQNNRHTNLEDVSLHSSESANVDDLLDRRNCDRILSKLIETLDEKDHIILEKFYFEGKKLQEIDELLNKGENYSRLRKFRCIERIKSWIKENPSFMDCWVYLGLKFE